MNLEAFAGEVRKLVDEIGAGEDEDAIQHLRSLLTDASSRLRSKLGGRFHVGDHVQWNHSGMVMTAEVLKVNAKSLTARVLAPPNQAGKRWRVSLGLVTRAAASSASIGSPAATPQAVAPAELDEKRRKVHAILRRWLEPQTVAKPLPAADRMRPFDEMVAVCREELDLVIEALPQLPITRGADLAPLLRGHKDPGYVLSSWSSLLAEHEHAAILLSVFHTSVDRPFQNDHVQKITLLRKKEGNRLYFLETAAHGYFFVADRTGSRAVCVGEEDEGIRSAKWVKFFGCDRYGR